MNSVIGHEVDAIKIGTAPSPSGQSTIAIAYDEYATLDSDDINVIVS